MSEEVSKLPMRIRDADIGDVNFIFNSWLKSYRTAETSLPMTSTVFFTEHHKVIQEILKTCRVLCAVSERDPVDIYGWLCAEEIDGILVVHYAYVKNTYRNLGICKLLLNQFNHDGSKASICTHTTRMGHIMARKYSLVYNPYVALTAEYRNKNKGTANEKKEVADNTDTST